MSFFTPPPKGFSIPRRRPDGSIIAKPDPKAQQKREAKLKSDMEKYEARVLEHREKLAKSVQGVTEKPTVTPPRDEVDLIVMGILANPAASLHGKGSTQLQTLTAEERRQAHRAQMDAKAAESGRALDRFLGSEPDEDEPADSINWERLAGADKEEADALLASAEEEDEDYSFLDEYADEDNEGGE